MYQYTNDPQGINRRIEFTVTESLINRFWSRVDKRGDHECWPWQAAFRNGYGAIKHQGRVLSAHRVAYVLTYGSPAADRLIAHTCDNRACCNPAHLEVATPGKNNRDARSRRKFFMTRGEDTWNARLTESDVHEIRRLKAQGHPAGRIAETLKLSLGCVAGVVKGKSWKHVK